MTSVVDPDPFLFCTDPDPCFWATQIRSRYYLVRLWIRYYFVRIRICCHFLRGPDVFGHRAPDPLLFCTDPDQNPSINKQKKVRKTLISIILRLLFDFLSTKTDENVPSRSNKHKYFVILSVTDEKAGSNPDP